MLLKQAFPALALTAVGQSVFPFTSVNTTLENRNPTSLSYKIMNERQELAKERPSPVKEHLFRIILILMCPTTYYRAIK